MKNQDNYSMDGDDLDPKFEKAMYSRRGRPAISLTESTILTSLREAKSIVISTTDLRSKLSELMRSNLPHEFPFISEQIPYCDRPLLRYPYGDENRLDSLKKDLITFMKHFRACPRKMIFPTSSGLS